MCNSVGLTRELLARTQPAEVQRPRASIIIVNYNAKEKVLRCLDSVLRHSVLDCEIILLDNASSEDISDSLGTAFPGVKLIRSQINLGFGAGNNLAARQAAGRNLVFVNPDTLVERGWLNAMIAPFENCAQIGLVTSKILLAGQPNRINACGNDVHFTGLTLCRGFGHRREDFDKLEEVDAVSGAAFAIRRELFEALKGFDEDTFLYMEDTDLSLRPRLSGCRQLFAPDSIVLHDYALRITPFKVFYQERNRYLMLLKILRWPTLLILLPALLLAEVITWAFVLYNDRSSFRNKLRAYRWIMAKCST